MAVPNLQIFISSVQNENLWKLCVQLCSLAKYSIHEMLTVLYVNRLKIKDYILSKYNFT